MTGVEAMRRSAARLALLLVFTLGVPAFGSAVPTDMSDVDSDMPLSLIHI